MFFFILMRFWNDLDEPENEEKETTSMKNIVKKMF